MASPLKTRVADLDESLFMPREISWLSFNARVLQEAEDPAVPVIQRLRYLGIFSSNMDEFFRVRVAEVRRLISVSSGVTRQQAKDLLAFIQKRCLELQKHFEKTYNQVLTDLRARRIYMVNEMQLDPGQLNGAGRQVQVLAYLCDHIADRPAVHDHVFHAAGVDVETDR